MSNQGDLCRQQAKAELAPEAQSGIEARSAAEKMVCESVATLQKPIERQAGAAKAESHESLPSLAVILPRDFTPMPWEQGQKLHMSYQMQKDSRVKLGEGPFHVAKRLLGTDAGDADVRTLTRALAAQYKDENPEGDLNGLGIGQPLVHERNVKQILNRIDDQETRSRIADRLKLGWNDFKEAAAVPFDHDARPGETQPDHIEDPDAFLKDIAEAAIDVGAADMRSKGNCAMGARLSFNELPLWHIEGGTVDKPLSKDPNGWRSGLRLAQDLAGSGLFDAVPLSEFGYKNLKHGYILGRNHYPDYVKNHPTWDGEDYGDIDIYTKKHKPPDDGDLYHDSFVLIPKKNKS
jgi:hypothetical protein